MEYAEPLNQDYNLQQPIVSTAGLRRGLTSYGDAHFSLFLRKVFIKALGYSEDALSRPIIGIINTASGFNPCHGNVPQLMSKLPSEESISMAVLPLTFPRLVYTRVSLTLPACFCEIS
jgi:dihydroxyacid dehydratase/phosphogluconate dehydratase